MGCDIRILQIEGAKDPDEFVVKYGPERFQKYVDSAISLVEFKVKMLKKNLDLENVNDKIKFFNEVAKILAKVDNNMEREVYIDKISLEYKVSKDAIYAEINKLLYANSKAEQKLEKKVAPINITNHIDVDNVEVDEKTKKRESLIIYLLVNYPDVAFEKLKNIATSNLIKVERNVQIINKLYDVQEKGNINIENLIDLFEDEDTVNYLSGIMSYDFEISDLNKCIEDVVNTYEKDKLINRRQEILDIIKNGQGFSEEELNNLEKLVGVTDVQGDGVVLTLEDNEEQGITASTLLNLVNELKYAGAEAISINNIRIVNSTDIVDVNYIIQIEGQKISSPYIVKCIGNQEYLSNNLNAKDGYLHTYTESGISVKMELQNNIKIEKYSGDLEVKYSKN